MKFTTAQWVAWLGATMVAAATLSAFAYRNFETIEHAKETKQDLKEMLTEIKADVKDLKRELIH